MCYQRGKPDNWAKKNLFVAQSTKAIYKPEIFIFAILFGDDLVFYDVIRNIRVFVKFSILRKPNYNPIRLL